MEEQAFKKILQTQAETAIPDDHDPWPTIHERLIRGRQIKACAEEKIPRSVSRKTGIRLATVALVSALLSLMFLAWTPGGRVLAQSVIRFFQTTDLRAFPVPAEFATSASQAAEPSTAVPTSMAILEPATTHPSGVSGCDPESGEGTLMCELSTLEAQLGFSVEVLPFQSSELVVERVVPEPASQSLAIYYTNPYSLDVSLRQGLGEFPSEEDYRLIPPEGVRSVRIAGSPGEIVRGMFVQRAGEDQLEWWPSAAMLRMRWREDQRWFEISRFGTPEFSTVLDEAELIWMAEHLERESSTAAIGFPTTAELAESQAGIDVKIPVAVPAGFHFRYAQVPDEAGRVMLVYSTPADSGPRGFMVINETREGADARWFGTAKVTHVTVGQAGARYVAGYNRGGESAYSPAELLAWSEGGLDFEILHFTTAEDGYSMRLGPKGMVAVAESLR